MEEEHKLGAILHAAREGKGATLAQAEKATRIRQKYLEALEEDRAGDLPEPVFVKGFLRNYAIFLGLNVQEVIDLWRTEHGLKKEVADVQPEIGPLRTPSRLTPAMLTVALALVVFSLVMYYLYQQYAAAPLAPTPTIVLESYTPTPTATAVAGASPQTPAVTRVPTPFQQDVTVPDVAGMTLDEAQKALDALGLRLEVVERSFSETAAVGIILSQTVRAQTKVQKDSVIGVTYSRGSQSVAVPRLVGLSYTEAVAKLTAVGLKPQKIEVKQAGAPDSVVAQDPLENAQVAPNSLVKLSVISASNQVQVPNVVGKKLEVGTAELQKAGLRIGQVSFQGKDKLPMSELVKVCEGCILSTTPGGDALVEPGAVINIGVRPQE
jgi:beta-lactam-binding protein with PASTA domain